MDKFIKDTIKDCFIWLGVILLTFFGTFAYPVVYDIPYVYDEEYSISGFPFRFYYASAWERKIISWPGLIFNLVFYLVVLLAFGRVIDILRELKSDKKA